MAAKAKTAIKKAPAKKPVRRAAPAKQAKQKKWVYLFEEVKAAERASGSWEGVRGLLGGKGAGLADMTRAGVPVPAGFHRDDRSLQ